MNMIPLHTWNSYVYVPSAILVGAAMVWPVCSSRHLLSPNSYNDDQQKKVCQLENDQSFMTNTSQSSHWLLGMKWKKV